MRIGSVCSGIEAASIASKDLHWEMAWFSEIEEFPCEVLAKHYPNVPNHGDLLELPSKISSGEVEVPDMIVGGTPCQAYSSAGKRMGMDDERGLLTLRFVELVDAVDKERKSNGKEGCIVFWENVIGVLNSKDNAFGHFLAGLAGEDVPLEPPGGRWTHAGCVAGPERTVAWRVLDAQYFGLAQRRKRVFVVASSGAVSPASVLFEFGGVRRDSPPSREEGAESAENPGGLLTGTDCYNGSITGQVAATMGTPGSSVNASGPTVMVDATVIGFKPDNSAKTRSLGEQIEMCPTLEAGGGGNNKPAILNKGIVRRLTPRECERLQGFPDDYTRIPWKNKSEEDCPIGHRYKAIGNSWATNCVKWLFNRIENERKK